MTKEQIVERKWFYGIRKIRPKPVGDWVAHGPFETHDKARDAQTGAKASDFDTHQPFLASTKEEARDMLDKGRAY